MSQATEGGSQEAQVYIDNTSSCKEAKESLNALPTAIQTGTQTSSFLLQIQANGVDASCLIDTGAAVSLISHRLWKELQAKDSQLTLDKTGHELVGVQGAPLKLLGECYIEVAFDSLDRMISTPVLVAEMVTSDVILGRDFLRSNQCTVEMGQTDQLRFTKDKSVVPLGSGLAATTVALVVDKAFTIPPQSEVEVLLKAPITSDSTVATWLVEPVAEERPVEVARALVSPENGRVLVRLLNTRPDSIELNRGRPIAVLEPVSPEQLQEPIAAVEKKSPVTIEKQEQLWEMVLAAGESLTQEEQQQLFLVALEFEDIFALQSNDFGRTSKIRHSINTGDHQPIRQPVRRMPPYRREEARKLLTEMLAKDVIQRSSSPWASPIVLVGKKDGSVRFCVDYRKVNGITRKDAYPLPRVDDTLDTLAGSKWFTTLDLISGYWQVELEEKDREKTAFCTPDGLFEFKVMPFGLCNAPATFQRLMDMVLAGLQWTNCLVYLDDIIVVGKTFSQHLRNLTQVFERLRAAGLKLKPTKCHLCSEQVEFLGHVVSPEGVSTDPKKIAKVAEWPIPTSKKEVQQFLGLAGYYRRFISEFAKIARPLHRLTEKTATFNWDNDCQEAFETLRDKLISAPILAFPDLEKPFILDTDASDKGIGAVLSQRDEEGAERVVAYASKSLSRAEQHYCVTRKELLAVVYFIRHFRPYLLGRKFMLRTDHGSLTWLANFREPTGQLARWLEQLQEFDFDICHRPGRRHQNADAMSRIPCKQCGRTSHGLDNAASTVAALSQGIRSTPMERSSSEIRTHQLKDPQIGYILKAKESGQQPSAAEARSQGRAARRLNQLWERLQVRDGTLLRQYEDDSGKQKWLQLVLPPELQQEVMREIHSGVISGHLGEQKMLSQLKERFYWPSMAEDVRHWCQTCSVCATKKSPQQGSRAPMQTIQAGSPMQVVAVDITGPLPESEAGNRYILVVGDYFTKWMEAYAIPDQEATTVATKLVDEFYCRFGPPEQLHSDQGKQFESKLIQQICSILKISKSRTTAYHPQCDGLVERFNRTLKHMLATSLKDHPFDWEDRLRKVCMAYNTSVQASSGYTPFYLLYGREARLPIDLMYGTKRPSPQSVHEYASNLKQSLNDAYSAVRQQLNQAHARQKQYYDRKVHGEPYKKGDLVWLHNPTVPPGQSAKLMHPWTGPYRIVERLSEVDYRIQELFGKKTPSVVHFDRLKRCHPDTRFPDQDTSDDTPQDQPENLTLYSHFDMELIEPDAVESAPLRRSTRNRQQPNRYEPMILHQVEFGTNSS